MEVEEEGGNPVEEVEGDGVHGEVHEDDAHRDGDAHEVP